jgi:HAD superfamily hydrolase (TIGR01509 family)
MPLEVMLFDVDGTLVDSNDLHARAWQEAFESRGQQIAYARIRSHIGMGGDKLVPALAGEDLEQRLGEELRREHDRRFFQLLELEPPRPFPRALELLAELGRRKLRTALVTSSERQQLERLERAAGVRLCASVDRVVTASGAAESKPAPDLVCAALAELDVEPQAAAMVGDTPYDANACRAAGVACIGVRSGGWSDTLLRAAGAGVTFADTGELCARLEEALALVSDGRARQRRLARGSSGSGKSRPRAQTPR